MSFKLLAVPERLFEPGDLVSFNGEWPQFYRNKVFRVTRTMQTIRERVVGRLAPAAQVTVNVDDIGLNPEYESWLYQVRIGVNPFLGHFYVRWPANDYTMQLQDPNFPINPQDDDLRYIGFLDHDATKKENPTVFHPEPALRFQFIWVKDQLPGFIVYADSPVGVFQKPVMRFLTNICAIVEETDQQTLEQVRSGKLLVAQATHYSEIGRRGI